MITNLKSYLHTYKRKVRGYILQLKYSVVAKHVVSIYHL